ncbi:MAG: flagellar export protein FliJ [Proteocatella sp.]
MKKFTFGLDTVLDYKNQILSNLKLEHGKIIAELNQQESILEELKQKYLGYVNEFNEKKLSGITIIEARAFEMYIKQIDDQMKFQMQKIAQIRKLEEKKRQEVIEARKEAAAIEKLKEKKIEQYNKDVKKSEELFIEEFVSNSMSAVN